MYKVTPHGNFGLPFLGIRELEYFCICFLATCASSLEKSLQVLCLCSDLVAFFLHDLLCSVLYPNVSEKQLHPVMSLSVSWPWLLVRRMRVHLMSLCGHQIIVASGSLGTFLGHTNSQAIGV